MCLVLKEPDSAAAAQKKEENHTKAEERYREALKELKSQRLKDHETQTRWATSQNHKGVKFYHNEPNIRGNTLFLQSH